MKTTLKSILAALAAVGVMAQTAQAGFFLNFDSLPSGTPANSFAPAGVSFGFGVYDTDYDSFGEAILGTDHWQVDPAGGTVLATDPTLRAYGIAPSPANALDGVDQTVLMQFATSQNIQHFSVVLDNSTMGNLGAQSIDFYNAARQLVHSLPVDETVMGFSASWDPGVNVDVSLIVFPNNAYFDNIGVAVPEPGTWAAGAFGLGSAAFALRRKLRTSRAA